MEAIGDLLSIGSGETANQYTLAPITQYQKDRRKNTKSLKLHIATNHSEK